MDNDNWICNLFVFNWNCFRNNIRGKINMKKEYLDLKEYKEYYDRGFRLCKMPYRKLVLWLVCIGIGICVITPFTNFAIPFMLLALRRFG